MDRIIERDTTPAGGATQVLKFLYSGGGDSPWATTAGPTSIQRTIALPGGAMIDVGTGLWSCPDLHGDTLLTTNGAGLGWGPWRCMTRSGS